jgi:3'-phosphoadenosine 5'-phosphosulfate sulfotransferase (PAPS reductase)/FAD synthetase
MTPQDLIDQGALVVVNHSGGKDSQALLIKMLEIVPRDQILVVHASLGEFEWDGALELAERQAANAGVPFIVARAAKSFLDMVERRFATRPDVPSFPSASTRQCTSDLKRGPIEREVRTFARNHGHRLIINATGIRAQESASRAKVEVFKRHERNSVAGRDWYDWAPIHGLTTVEVFATIAADGQEPHPAYAAGNERLSCVFCIMGSRNDILHGAQARPELFARLAEVEARTGYTMHMSRKSLVQIVAEAQALAIAA